MVPHGFGMLLLSSVDTDLMVLFLPASFWHGSQQMALPLLRLQQMAECPFGILLLELAKRSFGANCFQHTQFHSHLMAIFLLRVRKLTLCAFGILLIAADQEEARGA